MESELLKLGLAGVMILGLAGAVVVLDRRLNAAQAELRQMSKELAAALERNSSLFEQLIEWLPRRRKPQ